MVVNVAASKDLRDQSTGTVVVSDGTPGIIVGFAGPPDLRFQVTFTLTDGSQIELTRWVTTDEIIFDNGPAAALQAVAELDQKVISTVEYPYRISTTELLTGDQFAFDRTRLRITFQDGLVVDFKADINTGEIELEFS